MSEEKEYFYGGFSSPEAVFAFNKMIQNAMSVSPAMVGLSDVRKMLLAAEVDELVEKIYGAKNV